MKTSQGSGMADVLRGWTMAALTSVFVILYGAALLGLLKPLTDVSIITRLEPMLFVIVGYYFGRLPAEQTEKSLKDEIGRQTQKADAAQHSREQVLQNREALEEKLKNVKATLASVAPNTPTTSLAEKLATGNGAGKEELIRHSMAAALNILNA